MNQVKSFAMLAVKVALAYAAIAALQKHVMPVPVIGAYLPMAKG